MTYRRQIISKVISFLVGAVGLYILWVVWFPMVTKHRFESVSDVIFLFVFPIPATFVAVYFLYTAGNLWKEISSIGIHKLCVCLSIILVVLLLPVLEGVISVIFESDESFRGMMAGPIVMMIAGIFYLCLKKCFLKWFAIEQNYDFDTHRKATKLYWGLLAFLIWSSVSSTFELLPKDPQYKHVPANTWLAALIVFGSIPFAWGFYRIGLKLFSKNPAAQASP